MRTKGLKESQNIKHAARCTPSTDTTGNMQKSTKQAAVDVHCLEVL